MGYEWEYVTLASGFMGYESWVMARKMPEYKLLCRQGWEEWAQIPWAYLWKGTPPDTWEPREVLGVKGGVCVMRRRLMRRDPVDTAKVKEEARCEGRLWTEREIEGLFESWDERLYAGRGGDDAPGEAPASVLNEVLGSLWRLERRNVELQAAIEAVVDIASWKPYYDALQRAIRKHLCPLVLEEK